MDKEQAKKKEQLIVKIIENKSNGQKLITVPKRSNLKPGDYVRITKIEEI